MCIALVSLVTSTQAKKGKGEGQHNNIIAQATSAGPLDERHPWGAEVAFRSLSFSQWALVATYLHNISSATLPFKGLGSLQPPI